MNEVMAMPAHSDAAHEACWLGVAPTARAASMIRRMVEAKPTTTAVVADEIRLNQPPRVLVMEWEPPVHIWPPAGSAWS